MARFAIRKGGCGDCPSRIGMCLELVEQINEPTKRERLWAVDFFDGYVVFWGAVAYSLGYGRVRQIFIFRGIVFKQYLITIFAFVTLISCAKKSDESVTPAKSVTEKPVSESVPDRTLIKIPAYKGIEYFACKASDQTSVCQQNATKICQYNQFEFAEEYETSVVRRGYINPGEKLTFFQEDGAPIIREFKSFEDSLGETFDWVKCH